MSEAHVSSVGITDCWAAEAESPKLRGITAQAGVTAADCLCKASKGQAQRVSAPWVLPPPGPDHPEGVLIK